MRILIDIGHPAHVYLFKNFYHEMKRRGNDTFVTVKDLPAAIKLLDLFGIPHINIGAKSDRISGKAINQLLYNLRILSVVWSKHIEIGVGSSLTLAHVSKISRMKSVIFDDDDDDVQLLMTRYGHPFADYIVSPSSLEGHRKRKDTMFYKGYHELAYLHPAKFTPDRSVLKEAGLTESEPFFILRFNAFRAHHDKDAGGLRIDQKRELIQYVQKFGRIIITGESELEPEFRQYSLNISPDKIHSLLFFCKMFLGDSQTMTSEAAVLGVPAIRCNTFAGRISYLEEEEKVYGLTYAFHPMEFDRMMAKIKELLSTPDLKQRWQKKRETMLSEMIDVTDFMVNLAEDIYAGLR